MNDIGDKGSKKGYRDAKTMEYELLEDKKLIELIRKGDGEALDFLIHKYSGLVRAISSKYFLKGGEKEDVRQEGLIGLFKAITQYDPDKEATFRTFSERCIKNEIFSAVRHSMRKKNMPLNAYISIQWSQTDKDETHKEIIELSKGKNDDPENIVIDRERKRALHEIIESDLNEREKIILELYLKEKTYKEMSIITGLSIKKIDNMLQQMRKKIKRAIYQYI